MKPEDKATTTVPETAAHAKLEKLDRRDKVVRIVEVAILMVVVVFNVFLGLRLQNVIDQNQAASLQRSHEAQDDRDSIKAYIKCVLLIRFNSEPAALPTTKEAVSDALDQCAKQGE